MVYLANGSHPRFASPSTEAQGTFLLEEASFCQANKQASGWENTFVFISFSLEREKWAQLQQALPTRGKAEGGPIDKPTSSNPRESSCVGKFCASCAARPCLCTKSLTNCTYAADASDYCDFGG